MVIMLNKYLHLMTILKIIPCTFCTILKDCLNVLTSCHSSSDNFEDPENRWQFFITTFSQSTSYLSVCIIPHLFLFSWCRSRTEECHWQARPVCGSERARVWKNDNGETEGQPKILLPLWWRILQLLQVQACYGAAAAYVVKGGQSTIKSLALVWSAESSGYFVIKVFPN